MPAAAHSSFFGLDVNVNDSFDNFALTAEMVEQAQQNLQSWANVTSKPDSRASAISENVSVGPSPARETSAPRSPSVAKSNDSKVTKTFHFVENSDKKTATRIRNTLASRNLRQSKVNRIAQLEKELEKQLQEAEMWRQRAITAGWKE